MRSGVKILVYVATVFLAAGLLAPPLYWAAHAVMDAGWLVFLRKYAFQKYFNRSALLAAVVLLWPLVRWLGLRGWRPPVFRRDVQWGRRLAQGLMLGAGAFALLAGLCLWSGAYAVEAAPALRVVCMAAVSALAVGFLEEALFRGAVQGLMERGAGTAGALWATSALFAVVHFLKPDPGLRVDEVHFWSGLALVPHMFHQFANPLLLLGGFGTLLLFGLVLGEAARRTGSLWMSIGLHAGLVFVKLVFSKSTVQRMQLPPWLGPELQVGLAPVLVLLLMWWAVRRLVPAPEDGPGGPPR
jgi:membrane protease YdiL (CAAX protease family)